MTTPLYDDSNWREDYKNYTSNKRHLELLENGPKSLSQSWILQALYNDCLLYTSPSPRDGLLSRMPSSA